MQCLQHLHNKLCQTVSLCLSGGQPWVSRNKCWFASILWEGFSVKYSWYPNLLKNPTLPLSNKKVWCSYKLKRLPSLPIFLMDSLFKNLGILYFKHNLLPKQHTLIAGIFYKFDIPHPCFCTFWQFSLHGTTVMLFHFFFLALPAYS